MKIEETSQNLLDRATLRLMEDWDFDETVRLAPCPPSTEKRADCQKIG